GRGPRPGAGQHRHAPGGGTFPRGPQGVEEGAASVGAGPQARAQQPGSPAQDQRPVGRIPHGPDPPQEVTRAAIPEKFIFRFQKSAWSSTSKVESDSGPTARGDRTPRGDLSMILEADPLTSRGDPLAGEEARKLAKGKLFLRLFLQHERRLYAYILTLLPNRADADDVLQEVSLVMWEEFQAKPPPDSL